MWISCIHLIRQSSTKRKIDKSHFEEPAEGPYLCHTPVSLLDRTRLPPALFCVASSGILAIVCIFFYLQQSRLCNCKVHSLLLPFGHFLLLLRKYRLSFSWTLKRQWTSSISWTSQVYEQYPTAVPWTLGISQLIIYVIPVILLQPYIDVYMMSVQSSKPCSE